MPAYGACPVDLLSSFNAVARGLLQAANCRSAQEEAIPRDRGPAGRLSTACGAMQQRLGAELCDGNLIGKCVNIGLQGNEQIEMECAKGTNR